MRAYFSRLFGNDAEKERLGSAVINSSLPHALLFIGPEGSGKKTLTLELAAALNCERQGDASSPLPCHECNTCKRIFDNNYTDVKFLKRNGDRATIGVDEVRLFREDMFLSSTESGYKAYVIEDADRLTVNAQNALLTVLEEPPRNVHIILLASSPDKILTTVKSRAQSIYMSRFDKDALRKYLLLKSEKARAYKSSSPETLEGILMSADGRIGRALSLFSDKEAESNKEERALTKEIILSFRQSAPYSELYSTLAKLPTSRQELTEALEQILNAIRDLILIKPDSKVPLLFYLDRKEARELSRSMGEKRLHTLYNLITDALEDTAKNVSVAAVVTNLGTKIKLI